MAQSHPIARCHCGAVEITVHKALGAPIHCHCRQCRSLSGSAFTTWVSVPLSDCQLPDETLRVSYRPTANCTRWFCRHCGGHLFTQDSRMPDIIGIPAGAFADEVVPPAKADYFTSHRAPWHEHVPGITPQFGGDSGYEPVQGHIAPPTDA